MIEKQIAVKNLNTNYKVVGENLSGKPMIILHGWGSSSEKWQAIGEMLAQKNVKSVIPDLPGFGKSEAPHDAWSPDNYVEWLNEFSEKVPELKEGFLIMGHSFGGALGSKFAIKYTQKVSQLFLVSAACIRRKTGLKKIYYRLTKVMKIFSFIPAYPKLRKAFYKFVIRKSDYPYQSGVMKETYLKVILDDLSYKLLFVKVPTVIIWGDKDDSTPLKDAHLINEKIPHSKLITLEGADHLLHIKIPELLSQKVLDNVVG